jgi:hypothetical protein
MADAIIDYIVTPHAAFEMQRRGITDTEVRAALAAPEQRLPVRAGRDVVHAKVTVGGRLHLLRIFVDVDRQPPEVVTAYRTSKIEKYWRNEP